MKGTPTFLRICFFLTTFGAISLLTMIGRPTIADIRPVDIVHLIGTGMCFGGAIVAFAAHKRGRQSN